MSRYRTGGKLSPMIPVEYVIWIALVIRTGSLLKCQYMKDL
jgi:hypothetical protein